MSTDTLETRAYKLDAGELADTWLSVALASGKDEAIPVLCRTTLVEFFETGVRLVACDATVLLTGWVGRELFEPEPELDEAPLESVIATDPHGRGAGLMGHLRKLAAESAESGTTVEATMHVGEPPSDPTETLAIEGLARRALVIDHPGREELALTLHEGEYPKWRQLLASHESVETDTIALNPEIIGRLARLGKFHPIEPLTWRFGGQNGPALVDIGSIRGIAMPVRMRGAGIGDETPKDVAGTSE